MSVFVEGDAAHKLIFIDVDGVLNQQGQMHIDPRLVRRLRDIIDQTNAHIVVSSFWRLKSKRRRQVFAALLAAGLPRPIGYTPLMNNGHARAAEILAWLRLNTDNVFQYEDINFPLAQESRQFHSKQYRLPTRIYCSNFVVLDDLDLSKSRRGDELGLLFHNTVRTASSTGLTDENVQRAVYILTDGERDATGPASECCRRAQRTVYTYSSGEERDDH